MIKFIDASDLIEKRIYSYPEEDDYYELLRKETGWEVFIDGENQSADEFDNLIELFKSEKDWEITKYDIYLLKREIKK